MRDLTKYDGYIQSLTRSTTCDIIDGYIQSLTILKDVTVAWWDPIQSTKESMGKRLRQQRRTSFKLKRQSIDRFDDLDLFISILQRHERTIDLWDLSFLHRRFNFLILYRLYTTLQSLLIEDDIPTVLVLIELGELLRLEGGVSRGGLGHLQELP